ncbi:BrnA antitoxin family protein [Paradevosia shaoguanensis]|uniref:BrnA antitoxin family protein n=1 Tax=Paradevosia shaoguanensis TaxID=1335043 RepID=UPI003C73FEE0
MTDKMKPGQGYTQEDWDAVSDNPEISKSQLSRARPFTEAFPELAEKMRNTGGRPRSDNPKQLVSIRLDADVLDRLKSEGPGWQTRANAILKKAVGL